jgi:hypothetical protein
VTSKKLWIQRRRSYAGFSRYSGQTIFLGESDQNVQWLIIARDANKKLQYALNASKDVALQLYEIEFRLSQAPESVVRP